MFWARISKLLTLSFNSAFENGNLSSSQRKTVITLIHKGKDLARDNLKNWRPISLTNSDYKLLAKCLALRLGDVINDVVSGDQVGYIKGRRVSMLRTPFFDLYGRGDSKFLVCILPVTNVLLKLKRTGREGWKTLKE